MKTTQLLKKIINENLLDNCISLETYNCLDYETIEFGSASDISSFETVVFLIYIFAFQQKVFSREPSCSDGSSGYVYVICITIQSAGYFVVFGSYEYLFISKESVNQFTGHLSSFSVGTVVCIWFFVYGFAYRLFVSTKEFQTFEFNKWVDDPCIQCDSRADRGRGPGIREDRRAAAAEAAQARGLRR